MAVSRYAQGVIEGDTTQTASGAVDVGTDPDRVLLVLLVSGDSSDHHHPNAPTYNGVAMTQVDVPWNIRLGTQNGSGAQSNRVASLWQLVDPASGSNTLAIDMGASRVQFSMSYVVLHGADDVQTTARANDSSGSDNNPSVTATPTYTDSLLYGAAAGDAGNVDPYTPGTGVTEVLDSDPDSSRTNHTFWWGEKSGSGSQTIDATQSSGGEWVIWFVEVAAPQGTDHTETATDDAAGADTVERAAGFDRSAGTHDAGITDDASRTHDASRPVTDDAAAADEVSRAASYARSVTDDAAGGDSLSRAQAHARSVTDDAAGNDSTEQSTTSVIQVTITDGAAADDSASRIHAASRTFTDDVDGDDSQSRTVSFGRTFTDDAAGDDSVTVATSAGIVEDTVWTFDEGNWSQEYEGSRAGITDEMIAVLGQTDTFVEATTDDVAAADEGTYALQGDRDVAALTDEVTWTNLQTTDRTITDSAGAEDTGRGIVSAFGDDVGADDAFEPSQDVGRTLSRTFTDAAAAVDVLARDTAQDVFEFTAELEGAWEVAVEDRVVAAVLDDSVHEQARIAAVDLDPRMVPSATLVDL